MSAATGGGQVAVAGAVRTPVCRVGGALRAVPALVLASTVARAALDAAGLRAEQLGAVVVAAGPPADEVELAPARALAEELGAGGALALESGGVDDLGLAALAAGRATALDQGRAVLVVGTGSASRIPYWVPGARVAGAGGGHGLVDPLGAIVAAAGGRASGGQPRAEQDAFAARSHRLAAAPGPVAAVGGVGLDERPDRAGSEQDLAALMPLFDPDGHATAGSTAMPADGAAALMLVPGAAGPALGPPAATASAALGAADLEAAELAAAELHEGTAAEALAAAAELGLDATGPGSPVNAAGGAIGFGLPPAAGGLLMAERLFSRLEPGSTGLLYAPGWAFLAGA